MPFEGLRKVGHPGTGARVDAQLSSGRTGTAAILRNQCIPFPPPSLIRDVDIVSTALLFAHPRVIAWRNRLRRNSLVRTIYSSIAGRGDYEARFARELLVAVRTGDTVWDVGANVGVYASQFAERGANV